MFKKELSEKLKGIFSVNKVSFDEPGLSKEQECIFVEIEQSNNVIKDGVALARVTGKCVMFGQNDKLPFGFFSKKIKQADINLTKDLFFYDIETNTKLANNLVEFSFSFVYFFSGQYDPDMGTIDSITFSEV